MFQEEKIMKALKKIKDKYPDYIFVFFHKDMKAEDLFRR